MLRLPVSRHARARFLAGIALALGCGVALLGADSLDPGQQIGAWIGLAAAVLMLTYRDYVEVDTAKGRIARRTGLLYGFRRDNFAIADIEMLTLGSFTKRSGSDDDDDTTRYSVGIEGAARGRLCDCSGIWQARFIGERIARAIDRPIETRLFGAPSRRAPDEVDLQLAERWRRKGRFKEAPVLTADSRLTVEHRDESSELTMPVEPMPRLAIGIGAAVLSTVLVGCGFFTDADGTFFLWLFGGAVAFFGFCFVAQHSGRSRLRFTATEVHFRLGRSPLRQRMALVEIEELIVSNDSFVLMGDRHYIRIDRPTEHADREAQRQFIDRQIARRQRPD